MPELWYRCFLRLITRVYFARLTLLHPERRPRSPAEPEIRNPKLANKSELPGMGQWTNGKPRCFFAGCEQSRLLQYRSGGRGLGIQWLCPESPVNERSLTLGKSARE